MTKDEALRLALEALEYRGTDSWRKRQPAITAIKAALEAKDEPVACVIDGDLYFHHEIDWEDLAYQGHGIELLYTTPPQRTWVGLTDEDIEEEFGFIDELLRDCVQRTEAKLKDKNT